MPESMFLQIQFGQAASDKRDFVLAAEPLDGKRDQLEYHIERYLDSAPLLRIRKNGHTIHLSELQPLEEILIRFSRTTYLPAIAAGRLRRDMQKDEMR